MRIVPLPSAHPLHGDKTVFGSLQLHPLRCRQEQAGPWAVSCSPSPYNICSNSWDPAERLVTPGAEWCSSLYHVFRAHCFFDVRTVTLSTLMHVL